MPRPKIEKLQIFLVDDNVDLEAIRQNGSPVYPIETYGRSFSTRDEIIPETTATGYVILYQISDFEQLDKEEFIATLAELFAVNRPNVDIVISIDVNGSTADGRFFDEAFDLANTLQELEPVNLEIVHCIYDDFGREDEDDDEDTDDDDDECDGVCRRCSDSTCENHPRYNLDDDEEPYPRSTRSSGPFTGFRSFVQDEYDEDDDDERPRSRKKKKVKKDYGASRSIKAAKHPKRDVKRHNIVITTKKNFDRDEKIVREFLRDFIPGKAGWVKDYRKEVLDRWMRAFVIKEKVAKRRKEEWQEKQRSKVTKDRVKTVRSITDTITRAYNPFYDPKK